MNRPVLGAIAVVCHMIDGVPHVLLVQRGKAPSKGFWGFPGGHMELGETGSEAALRELREETSVRASPLAHLRNIDVIQRDDTGAVLRHYMLVATLCAYHSGTPEAADDAADARWMPVDALADTELPLLDQVADLAREARDRMSQTTPAT